MSDVSVLVITAVAILAVVVMIVRFEINPVVALVVGATGLGLATGLGVDGTVTAVTTGFGDIMAEVGLLIGFGVLLGSMLNEMGAIRRLVEALLRRFGPEKLPYTVGLTIGTLLQSIFLDVLLVISAPLARRLAPELGRLGRARMATALAISLECGIVLMVPGVGTLALAGLLGVPLGEMLVFGLLVVVPTIVVSIAIMTFLFRRGLWDVERDEAPDPEVEQVAPAGEPATTATPAAAGGGTSSGGAGAGSAAGEGSGPVVASHPAAGRQEREPRLLLLFTPLLVSLLLIAAGALADVLGLENPVVALVSEPVIALLLGVLGTSAVGRATVGRDRVVDAIGSGFRESGQILLLTGVGGSLATTVAAAGLGDILGGYFSASTVAPLVVVWVIAAVLHVAVGSVTISAITAAGLLAPVAPTIGLDPVLIALAAGDGSLFLVHVTSNTFWLLQSLLGQTTRGTLKSCSLGVSVASVVALGFVLLLSLFL